MSEDSLYQLSSAVHELALNVAGIEIEVSLDSAEHELLLTYKSLRAFLGSRTASINSLIGDRFLWDAEIILRAANECAAKTAFIFLDNDTLRARELAAEYYDGLASVFKKRDADRATEASQYLSRNGSNAGGELLLVAAAELMAGSKNLSARDRREIERRWGYTTILNEVISRQDDKYGENTLGALLYSYGTQSHIIHCNPAALGLAEDARSRTQTEGILKDRGHAARIYSEITGAWATFYLVAEQHYEISESTKIKVQKNLEKIQALSNELHSDFTDAVQKNGRRNLAH